MTTSGGADEARAAAASAERRFFLAGPPAGGRAELRPEEARHAAVVLRVRPGERVVGLDGEGGSWPLRVIAVRRGALELEVLGAAAREPRPGEPGAALPWIELAVSLPRARRAEELLDRAVQLGVAALTPLECERTQGGARELGPGRLARLERTAVEACKQARRAWLPELREPCTPAELALRKPRVPLALLSPVAGERLLDWALGLRAAHERPAALALAVGPEGGFTEAEERALLGGGARSVALAPHVLRIETAAEAAVALLAQVFFELPAQNAIRSRSDT